jgi:hypothetical protein
VTQQAANRQPVRVLNGNSTHDCVTANAVKTVTTRQNNTTQKSNAMGCLPHIVWVSKATANGKGTDRSPRARSDRDKVFADCHHRGASGFSLAAAVIAGLDNLRPSERKETKMQPAKLIELGVRWRTGATP